MTTGLEPTLDLVVPTPVFSCDHLFTHLPDHSLDMIYTDHLDEVDQLDPTSVVVVC